MQRTTIVTPTFGAMAVIDHGQGPVALFLHGVFVNGELWRHQVEALADLRRCIAIDLLAHGMSPCPSGELTITVQAQMVLEVIEALGGGEVDLVGNDTGGAIAQLVVTQRPEVVRSLTLTNCDVHDNFPPEAFLGIQEVAQQGFLAEGLAAIANDPEAIRAALSTSLEDPASIDDATLRSFFAPFTDPAHAASLQGYIASMEPSELVAIEANLGKVTVPTQIVWGTDDVFFPEAWATWLEQRIPGVSSSVRVEGGRLFFPLERPQPLNEALRRFWSARA